MINPSIDRILQYISKNKQLISYDYNGFHSMAFSVGKIKLSRSENRLSGNIFSLNGKIICNEIGHYLFNFINNLSKERQKERELKEKYKETLDILDGLDLND